MAAIAQQFGLEHRTGPSAGTAGRRQPAAKPRRSKTDGERVRLRIGNLAKAVLVTGQAYQDPKDALNEFVSNAADDYAEAGLVGARASGSCCAARASGR